jgi:hypothetical protein
LPRLMTVSTRCIHSSYLLFYCLPHRSAVVELDANDGEIFRIRVGWSKAHALLIFQALNMA